MSYDTRHHDKPDYYKLWVGDDYATEGEKLYFKIKIDHAADHDIKVKYWTEDGTAEAWKDYKPAAGTVTIEKGEDHAWVEVKTIDDRKYEPTEYMKLNVVEHDKYVKVKDSQGVGTIYDNDKPKVLKLSIEDDSGKEGETLKFKVKLDHKANEDVKVYYKTQDGTAEAWKDYKPEWGSVTIKEGTDTAYITIKTIDDKKPEKTEYFKVNIWENERDVITVDSQAVGTIYDNDHYKPHHDYPWGH